MHDSTPGPYTATLTVELIGGPFDGDKMVIAVGCSAFHSDPDTNGRCSYHYRYCPHASARLGKDCFIDAHVQHDLYAR